MPRSGPPPPVAPPALFSAGGNVPAAEPGRGTAPGGGAVWVAPSAATSSGAITEELQRMLEIADAAGGSGSACPSPAESVAEPSSMLSLIADRRQRVAVDARVRPPVAVRVRPEYYAAHHRVCSVLTRGAETACPFSGAAGVARDSVIAADDGRCRRFCGGGSVASRTASGMLQTVCGAQVVRSSSAGI